MITSTCTRTSMRILALLIICALAVAPLSGCFWGAKSPNTPSDPLVTEAVESPDHSRSYEPLTVEILPEEPSNTEEYRHLKEPGFIATATRPLSTLSADIDTAAYCNLRRMVRSGASPKNMTPGAVRTEEMLNYFTYDYATPQGNDLFGVTTKMAACPWNPDTKLLVMGFATESADYASSAGSNLVFLIDTSGSMEAPEKLPLLKDSFAQLTSELTDRDRVSIVTYSGQEHIALEGARGTDKRRIMRAIDSLQASGSTNGEAGLKMAYRLAEESFIEGGVNRIIMASDGDLNVGMTSESELHDFVSNKRATGVYLSVLGFGTGNYKDNKMEVLANNGNGSYHYIDCLEEAERVFGKNLNANLVPLADDVKLQVEFNPDEVKGYRLIGYENRSLADEDFQNDAADAGEVGAGHAFTVAYEVVPANSAFQMDTPNLKYDSDSKATQPESEGSTTRMEESEWLTCSMRYRLAGQSETVEQTHIVRASDEAAAPGKDWRFAAAVIELSMLLRDSDYRGGATYESVRTLIDASDDPARKEFASLVETLSRRDGNERRASRYADDE